MKPESNTQGYNQSVEKENNCQLVLVNNSYKTKANEAFAYQQKYLCGANITK